MPNGVGSKPKHSFFESKDNFDTEDLQPQTYGSIADDGSLAERSLWYRDTYLSDQSLSISSTETEIQDLEKYYHSGDQDITDFRKSYRGAGSFINNNSHDVFLSDQNNQMYYSSKNTTSPGMASGRLVAWNITNLIIGTSLLAFPFALQKGGLVVLPVTVFIALIMNYTSRLLINLMYEESTEIDGGKIRVRMNYADLAKDILNSTKGSLIMQIIQTIEMLAKCVLNICVLGKLTHEVVQKMEIKLCIVIAGGLALPSFFIQKLVLVGWLQTVGVLFLSVGLIIIQVYCLVNVSKWQITNLVVCHKDSLPLAIGIIVYAFGIHGVMPGLEEQMRKPQKFGMVVNITFFTAFLLQSVFSITNTLFYGDGIHQVITIDLQSHFVLGIVTAVFIGVSILCHFSLPTIVVMDKLELAVHRILVCCHLGDNKSQFVIRVLLRVFIISFSLTVAVFLPYFAYLMAFIGSSVIVLTSMVIPCLLHLKLRKNELRWYQVCLDAFIIFSGFVVMGFGMFYNFVDIWHLIYLEVEKKKI